MECTICGSQEFIEQDGYNYCSVCQTQSQHLGVTTEVDTDINYESQTFTREIKTKRTRKRKTVDNLQTTSSILWSTTEAFDLIIREQSRQLCAIEEIDCDREELSRIVLEVWHKYLKISGIPFDDNDSETSDNKEVRLHPASRFRDKQKYINKVNELPLFKNGANANATSYIRLGDDRVFRPVDQTDDDFVMTDNSETADESDFVEELKDDIHLISKQITSPTIRFSKFKENVTSCVVSEELDDFYINGNGSKHSIEKAKRRKAEKILSVETRNILKRMINSVNLSQNFDEFVDYFPEDSDEEIDDNSEQITERLTKTIDTEQQRHDDYDDYDKEIMKHLTDSGKLFTKYIPLSYLKQSRKVNTNYFIELMTLSKTLALINISLRLINCNVFTGDLIRWANEFHVSYYNCLPILPEDWQITSHDYQTFTSFSSPSPKTLNINTAKLAKHIGIETFDKPDFKSLITRFAKDLNLPKAIVTVILDNFDLYSIFAKKLDINLNTTKSLPFYDRWALMSIVMYLRVMFGLDDKTEYKLSDLVRNDTQLTDNVFIFDDWLKYTRLRFELIKSYYTPLKGDYYDYLEDSEVFSARLAQSVDAQNSRQIFARRKFLNRDLEVRKVLSQAFNEVACSSVQPFAVEFPSASLYPLTIATDFALIRARSDDTRSQMSINFEEKDISFYIPFRCDYVPLNIKSAFHSNISDEWSDNLKFLIELCCVMLYCNEKDLYCIIRAMDLQLDH